MKLLLISAIAVAMSMAAGCASTGGGPKATSALNDSAPADAAEPSSLQSKLIADLNEAKASAQTATDIMAPVRLKCWQFLLDSVPALPNLNAVPSSNATAGIFSAFEVAAEKVEAVDVIAEYQIPPELRVGLAVNCGPIASRAKDMVARWGLKLVNVGGAIGIVAK